MNVTSEPDDATIIALEESRECPNCGGSLDSGCGFGCRDLECNDCTFSLSYDAARYFDLILKGC